MLHRTLTVAGHICEEAEDGQVAVDMVKSKMSTECGCSQPPYDAILMDFVMPNMDGATSTKEIRKLGYTNPIFGVTGNTIDTDIDRFMKAGATQVFPKPFNVAKFHAIMNVR